MFASHRFFANSPRIRHFIHRFGFSSIPSWVLEKLKRVLTPLRRVVSRELISFRPDPRTNYKIYSLRDVLECGHEQEHYLWGGLRDVLFAYTENPLLRARRHRCQPCASLEQKKPVQSVRLTAKKAGAM